MGYYIYVNKDGKELRRETKGRGRTRTGAEERGDGNWFIRIDPDDEASFLAESPAAVEPESHDEPDDETLAQPGDDQGDEQGDAQEDDQSDEQDSSGESKPVKKRVKRVKAERTATLEAIIASCNHLGTTEEDDRVTINWPMIKTATPALVELETDAVFQSIVVDRNTCSVTIYNPGGSPRFVIENALVKGT